MPAEWCYVSLVILIFLNLVSFGTVNLEFPLLICVPVLKYRKHRHIPADISECMGPFYQIFQVGRCGG